MSEGLRPNKQQAPLFTDVTVPWKLNIFVPTKATTKQEVLIHPYSEREYPFKQGKAFNDKGEKDNLTIS